MVTCLYRGTAILLLLTCADMLSPQTCAEELFGIPAVAFARAAAAEGGDARDVTAPSETSHTGESSDSDHPEEDCFCCCTHLIVRAHFTLETETPGSVLSPPEWLATPTSPRHSLYRPPRSL